MVVYGFPVAPTRLTDRGEPYARKGLPWLSGLTGMADATGPVLRCAPGNHTQGAQGGNRERYQEQGATVAGGGDDGLGSLSLRSEPMFALGHDVVGTRLVFGALPVLEGVAPRVGAPGSLMVSPTFASMVMVPVLPSSVPPAKRRRVLIGSWTPYPNRVAAIDASTARMPSPNSAGSRSRPRSYQSVAAARIPEATNSNR